MITWMMAHPWMTLFIIVLCMYIIDNIICNICNTIYNFNSKKK